jgi:TatD DNase family protein
MGYFISFGGSVTYGGKGASDVVHEVPLSRMLVETDAPYLAPVPHRGSRNEPAFILKTAQRLAEMKEVSVQEIGERTTENACAFFKVAVGD